MIRPCNPLLPLLAGVLALVPAARAQVAPFDMSPERSTLTAPVPQAPVPPAPQIVPRQAPAQPMPPRTPPAAPAPTLTPAKQAAATSAQTRRRYLVPARRMVLEGERAERNWSIYLEDDEASDAAELQVTFQNAVVVAPEASALKVFINGNLLVDEPIAAADAPRPVRVKVPAGLLQPGGNRIRMLAVQRHRTDCDIRSTYDLWTEIDPSQTFILLDGHRTTPDSIQESVRAMGVDATGASQFQIWMPALGQTNAAAAVLRLSQGLALMAAMPNLSFQFSATAVPTPGRGQIGVIIGTWSELQPLFPALPETARQAAIATVLPGQGENGETLLVSGPTWDSIRSAVDTIIGTVDPQDGARQDIVATQRWSAPDAPLLLGGENIPLSQLGIETVEFGGRRLRMAFTIAVPSDFYANAYGEATLLLDAAFTDEVRPGSHIDVYVNGNIASTLPIKATQGGIFNQLPVKVPLRHIQPGPNRIWVEVALDTAADAVCLPGTPAADRPRFAVFDSSRWVMPRFARLGQIPNLSELAGTLPSVEPPRPLLLSMDRLEPDTLGAAATLLGKRAMADGAASGIELGSMSQALGSRDALFVGTAAQIPPKLLTLFGIDPTALTSWHPQVGSVTSDRNDTPASMSKWRSQISGSLLGDRLSALEQWMNRSFDISIDSLDIIRRRDGLVEPSVNDTVVLSQTLSPDGGNRWTAAIASTSTDLRDGVIGLTEQENWRQIAGRQTAYRARTGEVIVRSASEINLVQTVPFSLANFRLIATNWLSSNILIYAIVVVALCSILGIATTVMLSRMGRRT